MTTLINFSTNIFWNHSHGVWPPLSLHSNKDPETEAVAIYLNIINWVFSETSQTLSNSNRWRVFLLNFILLAHKLKHIVQTYIDNHADIFSQFRHWQRQIQSAAARHASAPHPTLWGQSSPRRMAAARTICTRLTWARSSRGSSPSGVSVNPQYGIKSPRLVRLPSTNDERGWPISCRPSSQGRKCHNSVTNLCKSHKLLTKNGRQ